MAAEYIKSYQDKSRIYFIEKYLSTFDASKGKKTPFICFPRQKVFLRTLAKVRNIVTIKPRQCGITTLTSAWATAQCVFATEDAPETILCVGNKLDLANLLISKYVSSSHRYPGGIGVMNTIHLTLSQIKTLNLFLLKTASLSLNYLMVVGW